MRSFKKPGHPQSPPFIHTLTRMRTVVYSLFLVSLANGIASAQLDILAAGDVAEQWRIAQISVLEEQLRGESVRQEMEAELTAQVTWLTNWRPGNLSDRPLFSTPETSQTIEEPTIDPKGIAGALRGRLLGRFARPTIADTQELKELLSKYPEDIGVRQLHLHWLDQLHYRKEYCDAIAEAARKLIVMLDAADRNDEDWKWGKAYCLYRRGRALAYRELPDVIAKRPIQDRESHAAALLTTYSQLNELVGSGRPEFILLEVRMLRRDQWFGRALALLEKHADIIDRKWYLKKRRDLLQELGWTAPSKEAANIYAKEFPEAAAEEQKVTEDP